jgi:hypothetical protein
MCAKFVVRRQAATLEYDPRVTTVEAVCPACGAISAPEAERCEACDARLRPRLRGAAAGVRIDHDRLEAIADLDIGGGEARWGPANGSGSATQSAPEQPSAGAPTPTRRASDRPPALPEPAAGVQAREAAASAQQAPAPTAYPASAVDPDFRAPLDAEVVVFAPGAAPEAAAAARPAREPRPAVRPPVLASEALLRDLTPAEPAPLVLRVWSIVGGILGLGAVTLATGQQGIGVPLSVLLLALVVLGLAMMPYAARATAVLAVSGSGLALVLWTEELAHAVEPATLLLSIAVTLLATGLFLRSWHRASLLARTLVVLGIMAGAAHLALNDAVRSLTMLDTQWQSWAPRVFVVVLCLLLVLALLAFMDARSTGACSVWAGAVLLFHSASSTLDLLRASWPNGTHTPDLARIPPDLVLAWIVGPLFNAAFAIAIAQMLAMALARANLPTPQLTVTDQRPT